MGQNRNSWRGRSSDLQSARSSQLGLAGRVSFQLRLLLTFVLQSGFDKIGTKWRLRIRARINEQLKEISLSENEYDGAQHLGVWQHFAVGYNGQVFRLFIDGQERQSASFVGTYTPETTYG